jgi:DNA-binding NarL/FixJ family response regulator
MGAIAVCLDLHLEATAGRLDPAKVLLLLDRRADVFTAKRSGADGFLIKPLNAILLRRAVSEILVGNLFVDNSYKPLDGLSSVSTRLPSTL